MSIWRRYGNHGYPSLVTTNVEHRRRLFESPVAARLLLEVLGEVNRDTGADWLAWVVMPDHVHLVVNFPPASRPSRVIQHVKGRFARRFNQLTGSRGSIWQERFHERALRSERAFERAVSYVHFNPVEAGLVDSPEKYRWSSARAHHMAHSLTEILNPRIESAGGARPCQAESLTHEGFEAPG